VSGKNSPLIEREKMQYAHASKAGKLKVVQAQEKKESQKVGCKSVAINKIEAGYEARLYAFLIVCKRRR
jgi:hypothetical protein